MSAKTATCKVHPGCTLTKGHKKACDISVIDAPRWECGDGHTFYSNYDMWDRPCPARRGSNKDYQGITGVCNQPLRRM